MNEAVERWLALAAEDLRVAELVLPEGLYGQGCFHAQQCVEKALKAARLVHAPEQALPRTHSIAELLRGLPSAWFADSRAVLAEALDNYYLPTRYPDTLPGTLPEGLPGRAEAEEATALARQALEEARHWAAKPPKD